MLGFIWDPQKAESNFYKHGIRFEEAASAFRDPLAMIFGDEEHSWEERRELIIGLSSANDLLIVSFIEAAPNLVRVISARKVTKAERVDYENR